MKLYFIILNFMIYGFLKRAHSFETTHNEDEMGVSAQALMKLQYLKNLELNIIYDLANKNFDKKGLYKKYHCISSDDISHNKENEQEPADSNSEQGDETNKNQTESAGVLNKMSILLSHWKDNIKNNLLGEKINDMQELKETNEESNDIYKVQKNEITNQNQVSSYVELQNFNLLNKKLFLNGKESNENFEAGNLGSFYMLFGVRGTDYPWACACDPRQLIEFKNKARNFVLCNNQIDMSIQNKELYCNPLNSSHLYHLSYFFIILIIFAFF